MTNDLKSSYSLLYKADGNTRKIVINVIYTYSTTYSTVSCYFSTSFLNKSFYK